MVMPPTKPCSSRRRSYIRFDVCRCFLSRDLSSSNIWLMSGMNGSPPSAASLDGLGQGVAHSCDTPVAPHASEFLTQSCDQSQNVGPPHSCSSHPHGTHGVPDYTVPQNTSPRPQLVCFRLQNGGVLLRDGTDHPTDSVGILSPGFTHQEKSHALCASSYVPAQVMKNSAVSMSNTPANGGKTIADLQGVVQSFPSYRQ